MSKTVLMLGENPNYKVDGLINFTTIHLRSAKDKPQRIIAAFHREEVKEMEGGLETKFHCQFAFCSPQERTHDKLRGQEIAYRRLIADGPRGYVSFVLPEGFTHQDLRERLKGCALRVAKRKNIRWLEGVTEDGLV